MDSKYASVGKEKENKNSFDNIKVKKIKLCSDNNLKQTKDNLKVCETNGVKQNSLPKSNSSYDISEDIHEVRKTLPVYVVRER